MRFIDAYFYKPNVFHKCLSIALLPISALYALSATIRRKCARNRDFHIPIISVGNLVAGGSGKTPFIIEVARAFERVAIVSRGYKRESKGLVVVSEYGTIKATQKQAGDEAYLIARELKNASVIVCKNRAKAIECAKNMGASIIFLDDGFRFRFKKLNIVLEPLLKPYFSFTLPSGIYRELPSAKKEADIIVKEGADYTRIVSIDNPTASMLFLTAIANPTRLRAFLSDVSNQIVGEIMLKDHANFDIAKLKSAMQAHNATSLLVTSKDEVKLLDSNLPLSIMRLKLDIHPSVIEAIRAYIASYK